MERITKGTKEYLIVPVTDSLGNLTSLGTTTYDIYTGDSEKTPVLVGATAVVDSLTIFALVDTVILNMEQGPYDLFVKFDAFPETPRLGPFRFRVDD